MIVGVHPLAGFDKLLHYKVPDSMRASAAVGSLVRVPVGHAMRLGVIGAVGPPSDFPLDRLKSLVQVVYPFPALTADLLELARWMSVYYAAPLDSVIEAMIPAAVRRGARVKEGRFLSVARKMPREELAALSRKAPAQARLYAFLEGQIRPQPKGLLLSRTGSSAASVGALVARGILREDVTRIEREGYVDDRAHGELVAAQPHALNAEQAAAVEALAGPVAAAKFGVTLLHGITGSGKTEVYLRAIQAALESGGGVILLVPEVALTPQTVARLRSRLEAIAPGHRCVVWHSHLGEGERLDGWLALASGDVRVAVGARSAVFAPVRNLRLVVVDEEHEPAYKQDESPRYHGRDVAVMRARLCAAQCLLGSATPSLESYSNALAGRYGLVRLTQRVDDRSLPPFTIVDMRIEVARKFTQDCHELGIKIHGTFILGLPGETKDTIEETIRFATDINPHTIQVSLAALARCHAADDVGAVGDHFPGVEGRLAAGETLQDHGWATRRRCSAASAAASRNARTAASR